MNAVEAAVDGTSAIGGVDVPEGGAVGVDAPKPNAAAEGTPLKAGALLVASILFWPNAKPSGDKADVDAACDEEVGADMDAEAPVDGARISHSAFCPKPAVGLSSAADDGLKIKPVLGGIVSFIFASVGTLVFFVEVTSRLKPEAVVSFGADVVIELLVRPKLNEGVDEGALADSLTGT